MSIEKDIKKLIKNLDDMGKRQIPYAASLALNETAKDVKKGVERQLKKDIDRPTPFTQRGFRIKWAKKSDPKASVYIMPKQAEYLTYQVFGGSRNATRSKPVIIPRERVRNKYGNLPRGKLAKLSSQGRSFVDNNIYYQKLKRTAKPIAYFADRATYKPRFRFHERGYSTARKVITNHFRNALQKAIKTAR